MNQTDSRKNVLYKLLFNLLNRNLILKLDCSTIEVNNIAALKIKLFINLKS